MASDVQNGLGILRGITNSGSAITMSGYATFILDTVKGNHKFKIDDIEDEDQFTVATTAVDPYIELDITWTPSGATRAAAATTASFLVPLAKVTLANFKVSDFNGDYQYRGDASIDLSHGPGKMTLKIRKWDDSSQNASLTTTVSG